MEIDSEDRPDHFQGVRIEGPDSLSAEKIALTSLPFDCAEGMSITQTTGGHWLTEGRSSLLQVPSVRMPETWKVSVNPQHAEASSPKIAAICEHGFDFRLL
jgi:hypothetical protein